jgi:hypothetical protein
MKQGAIGFIQRLRLRAARERWLLLIVFAFLLAPPAAQAAGMGDILSLIKTITETIQGAIGGALGGIQTLQNTVNDFRRQVIWPLDQINRARAFVTATQMQYSGLMLQIQSIRNNSATLTNPSRLELVSRSGQSAAISQLQPLYTGVYGNVPSTADALRLQRNLIDIDDALAQGALKTTVLSDETTRRMLAFADAIELQSAAAAPGSAPMLATQAGISELESQAFLAKVLASELRQEAARLAHQNSILKQSATSTRNLMNQARQVLAHP